MDDIQVYEYDRNRRPQTIPKGARAVSVVSRIHRGRDYQNDAERMEIENKNRILAVQAYRDKWGDFDWQDAQITHTHVTVQCVTGLVVFPPTPRR